MPKVVFDSSFLMAVVEHPTTWLEDMTELVGKVQPIALRCTIEELRRISTGITSRSRTAALALELAKGFSVEASGKGKVDDEIVSFASSRGSLVATVDRELINTLRARRLKVVGLRGGRVSLL